MIDIIIVFLYLILLLIISIFYRSKKPGFKKISTVISDKIQGNKLLLVATIFSSTIGGGTTFGIVEKIFDYNLAYSYGLMLVIPIDIAIAYYLVPRIIKHYGAETIGDIMHTYYGNIGRYVAGLSSIILSVGLVAAQISVSAKIFEYMLKINYVYGIILSYGIIVIYTTIGGLRSVLFANQLQFFAIIIAIPLIAIFGIHYLGFTHFIHTIPIEKVSFYNNHDLLKSTTFAMLGFAVMNLFPTFIQRTLINKDNSVTSKAIYIKSIIYAIFLIFISIDGLLAFMIFPDSKAALALPQLINHTIPNGIQGIVIVGLLAAVMSTADADLNIVSISLVKDFIKPIFRINNSNKMLKIARITNVVIGSFSIIIALYFKYVTDLVIFVSGFWGPIILVPFVFALFNIKINKKYFLIPCICGVVSFIIWEIMLSHALNFKGVFIGTLVNLVCFLSFYYIYKYNQKKLH